MKAVDIPQWARDDAFDETPTEIRIDSWAQFEDAYDRYFRRKRGRFVFRGQRDAGWKLQTTLERLLDQVRLPVPGPPEPSDPFGASACTLAERVELLLLRAFQARASKFLTNLPAMDETLEWLALMRHWSVPTRLMDVTTSPYVALYFALAESLHEQLQTSGVGPDPVVWAINHIPLRGMASQEATGILSHADLSGKAVFNHHFFAKPPLAFVAPVHPRMHSDRLAAQQGTFLCVGNTNQTFADNLARCAPVEDIKGQGIFRRLIINSAEAIGMLGRLSRMNIHSASLFPDLHGYTQFVEASLLQLGKEPDQYERHLDFESLERLGWLG